MKTLSYCAKFVFASIALGAVAQAQPPTPAPAAPLIVLYEHANFQGAYIILHPWQDVPNLKALYFNDRASSVRVFVPWDKELVLFEHLHNGNQIALRPGYWECSDLRLLGLNDKISSVYWK